MCDGFGGPDVLSIVQIESPACGPGAIRVKVEACGLNRADILQRKGFYPPPAGFNPMHLGLEFAGRVTEVGKKAEGWKMGDRVMGLVPGGAFSEELTMPAEEAIKIPEELSYDHAAAIPEAFLTAFDALEQLELSAEQRILIHAAGSGVGVAAIQLAKQRGAEVIGTARTQWKLDRGMEFGMDSQVLAENGVFKEKLSGKVDKVLDFIGAAYLEQNIRVLSEGGSIIVVGLLGGSKGTLNLGLLLSKKAKIIGTTLRSRSSHEKIKLVRNFNRNVLPLFASNKIKPVVDSVFPMTQIREAQRRMEENLNFGKIILRW